MVGTEGFTDLCGLACLSKITHPYPDLGSPEDDGPVPLHQGPRIAFL